MIDNKFKAVSDRDILVGVVDGMDRSKFAIPRWQDGRVPKGSETRPRPSLEVYAVLLHGRCVNVFITDECQTTGACWALEILCRSVQKAWEAAQRKGEPFPLHMVIWGDNTPKELRNSCTHRFFSAIASAGLMTTASLKHLPVGHTHVDVGHG